MKLIDKNYLTCLLVLISLYSFAQQSSEQYIIKRDTIGKINLASSFKSFISIKKGNLEFKFGKDTTIAILKENIKLMEPIQNRPEYPFIKKQIDDCKKIIAFLNDNKICVIVPTNKSYEEVKNNIETLTAYYLNVLFYCDFVDRGDFELFKNGVKQTSILKVKLEYSDAVSATMDYGYFLNGEKEGIWYCSVPY